MKLKQWLQEQKGISYKEYKALPDIERWSLEGEFRKYNAKIQRRDAFLKKNPNLWRKATPEEIVRMTAISKKEKERYEHSLKIGGIDLKGNYTALHRRFDM